MDKKASVLLILIVLIVILVGGIFSYFLFIQGKSEKDISQKTSEGIKEIEIDYSQIRINDDDIKCNVGNIKVIPTSEGIASGLIKGTENIKLMNGETLDLCCYEVETESKIKLKICSRSNDNNLITHSATWKFDKSKREYIKYREYAPQFNAQCNYNFDSEGNFESRNCEEAIISQKEEDQESKGDLPVDYKTFTSLVECDTLEDETTKKFCYAHIAGVLKDISLCEILDGNIKEICHQNVAIAKEDVSICDKISDPFFINMKRVCYKQIALNTGDESICENADSKVKDDCYHGAAVGKIDETLCSKIIRSTDRNSCYLDLANVKKDK